MDKKVFIALLFIASHALHGMEKYDKPGKELFKKLPNKEEEKKQYKEGHEAINRILKSHEPTTIENNTKAYMSPSSLFVVNKSKL